MATYPGDTADPTDVARWMYIVASEEYGLPGILPVMCSCVELTAAWTGPGDVKDVPGYLYAEDHDSLGYFQQRPSAGWGSPAQLTNADYALRAFCKEAAKYKGNYANTSEGLGEWCADVQRPREDLRYLYASKGYPMAKALLEGEGVSKSIPIWEEFGWFTWESATSWNLVYYPPKKKTEEFAWPEANDPPRDGNYQDRHPTRYTWRDDVERIARNLVTNYNVMCNTYYDHPEGYLRDADSIDVWGPGGRNDPIDPGLGDEIFNLLFNDPEKPDVDWIIFKRTIYGAWNGWRGEAFGTDPFSWHDDHIHCTYV